jgi:hypothetical protein
LVCDFEPGTVTVACTGADALGAVQDSVLTCFILPCRRVSWVLGTMDLMCGRFAVTTDPALLAEKIKAIDEATGASESAGAPNYNVAPTSTIATVVSRHTEPDDQPTRRVRLMRWGLVPPWAKAGSDGAPETKGASSSSISARRSARRPGQRLRLPLPESGVNEQAGQSEFRAPLRDIRQPNVGLIHSACCLECFNQQQVRGQRRQRPLLGIDSGQQVGCASARLLPVVGRIARRNSRIPEQ